MRDLVMLGIQASILGTVFCYGLQATLDDALHLVRHRSLLLRSLISMFVVMPAAALVILGVFDLPKATAIVLVALAISPIPPMLPKKERKAGGLADYGLGLMLTVGLLAIVIVPLAGELLARYFGRPFHVAGGAIAKPVLMMIAAPLVLGMLARAWKPEIAARLVKPLLIASTVLLVVCALAIIVGMSHTLAPLIHDGTLWAMLLFALIGLVSGHWLGGPIGEQRTVLALSTASRHPAIALAIAKSNFPDEHFLAATVVLYLLVVTVTVVPYVQWRKRATRD
ncbi:bile acid:sodium symporter family protein [Lysobacter panacisoli]|uniref:Na+-dependent transporter n=1 Tax=Lysobacter panacisoli TaxID=1255263 RepID=A0ABP9L2A7_9GAMM|nr:Na+-dependent transporter [Lysobacter panacisoli]